MPHVDEKGEGVAVPVAPDERVAAPLKADGCLRPAIAWTIMRCLEPLLGRWPRIADAVRAFAPFA